MEIDTYSKKFIHYYTDESPSLLKRIIENNKHFKSLVDLGCGDGAILCALNKKRLLDQFDKVYAVDLAEVRIENVRQISQKIRCLISDVCNLNQFNDDQIDLIISHQIIEHVKDDELMIKEMKRILHQNGIIYLATVFKKWHSWFFYKDKLNKWVIDPTHEREYTEDTQLLDKLIKYNFEIIQTKKTLHWFPIIDFILKRLGFKQNVYEKYFILKLLREIKIPILGYYNWEIVCRNKSPVCIMDKILIITNSHAYEEGLSGGERIAIELYRRWSKKCKISIYTSNFGKYTWEKCEINTAYDFIFCSHIVKNTRDLLSYIDLAISYLERVFDILMNRTFREEIRYKIIIYSSSDFWPDSMPAFMAKFRNPRIKWIAGFYQFAPKPWRRDTPYKKEKWIIGLFYWLSQLPIYWIIKRYADMVFVTSEPDVERFITNSRGRDKIIVVRGGIDIKPSSDYLNSEDIIPVEKRKYDACFIGRFHYQKGVLELVDIWKLVCAKKLIVKLAMIGIGPLENTVKNKIKRLGLEKNIELLGFMDGELKYEIFKQSKIIVHPAIYDSGGMAACEAMAWGLPAVSFDLEALKTYYPRGMIKIPCFDLKKFAENIIRLFEDKELYNKTKQDAICWAREWDWDKRAELVLDKISNNK